MEELSDQYTFTNGLETVDSAEKTDWSELDVRSEEVQEIIGRPPHWLIRGGIVGFLGMLLLILLSAWFVEYPETIKSPLKLTAISAPKTMASKINGKLVKLTSDNNTYVREGEVLAWLESTASHQEVLTLSARVDRLHKWLLNGKPEQVKEVTFSTFSDLGELQTHFQPFEQTWREFTAFLSGGFYHQQRRLLEQEMAYTRQLLKQLREQKQIQQQDYQLAQQEYDMQKKLAERKLIAPLELAQQKSKLLSRQLPLQQTESGIINNRVSQAAKRKELMELDRQISQEQSVFLQALNSIRSAIDDWETNYLIIAPMTGKLVFAGILQENQTLKPGQDIFYIQPDNTKFFGQLMVSQNSFGKIREGQQVLVRFSSYPDQEFGSVTGNIKYLSDIPVKDSVFMAKVDFPEGLTTNYGKELTPRDGMLGQAEIITQDMRLLERFYNNIAKQLR